MELKPGSFLLTSGVGGTDWKSSLLAKVIIAGQKIREPDSRAEYGHAEIIVTPFGDTFAARLKTREYRAGIDDYIGAKVMIVEPVGGDLSFDAAYKETKEMFDGDHYPVARLILLGLSSIIFPWLSKIGIGSRAICSEVVAFCEKIQSRVCFWRGTTPAMLEDYARDRTAIYRIAFEGTWKGINNTFTCSKEGS